MRGPDDNDNDRGSTGGQADPGDSSNAGTGVGGYSGKSG